MTHEEFTEGVEPIAVIGMAARVPGAGDVDQFWRNLVDGVESITFYTREEQLALGVTEEELADPSWVSAAPVIDELEHFDAELFGMTPREAELANPQHRLFLETSHSALEDAGYDPVRYPGAIGVYAGTGADHYQWTNLFRNAELWQKAAGNLGISSSNFPDYVATLVSYKLNLRGPSLTVHTACSTSLVATHLAVEALRNGECDMALAGGVCVELPHGKGYQGMEGYTSPDGHCRPFDARADGTLWGSGVGVVVLKRLSDAIADGDHVRGVVLGNAINNDGSDKVGFSAPSVEGQVECVAQALAVADIDPRTVGYVEAHGTGTALGDPIEVAALSTAYAQGTDDRQWCALGSVKSNLGHLSQAAGVIGLIKTVLALEHRLIPSTINFESVNPAIDLENSPFHIATTLSKWESDGTPRRAAVSSFGIGGTNAHLILEEAPAPEASEEGRVASPAHLLQVSAHTEAALSAAVGRLAAHLEDDPDRDLADIAYTLRVGRTARAHRAVVVASDPQAAVKALRKPVTGHVAGPAPRVAFLFTGQGGQYAGMGAELYEAEPVFRAVVDECAAILEPELGLDIRTLMFTAGNDDALGQTRYTQPALFVLEYALAALWRHWGVEPAAMIGHSIGEYVAATLAGVFEPADALRLVAVRGRLMQSVPEGSMLSVSLDESEVADRLAGTGCAIATVNAPGACVVSGPTDAVAALAESYAEQEVTCRVLRTSHAFHSPMMDPILEEFAAAVAAVPRRAPRLRFLSNVTGLPITDEQATDPAYWATHLRQPVRFGACVAALLADGGEWALVECGPGRQLSGLARRQLPREAMAPLPSLPGPGERIRDVATLYAAVGRLWVAGVEPAEFGAPGRRVSLPTYPYQRKRHWVDPDPDGGVVVTAPRTGPLPLDDWFAVPTWRQLPPSPRPAPEPAQALVFVGGERGAALAGALRADGVSVTVAAPGDDVATDGVSWIVHAGALDAEPAGTDVDAAWRVQETGFFAVLRLVQALAGRHEDGDVRLDVLTTGAQDVLGPDLTRPEQATSIGLARVLPLELPWLSVRHVDVTDRTTSGQLAAELRSAGPSVALRSGRRWALDYEQVSLPANPDALREQGRYLVTGGLGGIGITLAEDLAERFRARLALVSRTGLPPRADWDTHLAVHGSTGRVGRAIEAVRRMERAGATVLVLAADVTDPVALRRVRDRVVAELGGLDGIVHAAGLAGGGMTEVKDHAVAERVLAPKLAGTLALRQAFGDLPLDFVALCSSVTGIVGGFGQVDYCAANAFLDAYARSDHGWPCRVLSLNWGGWQEVGMVVDGLAGAATPEVAEPVDHPLLGSRGESACWGVISPESQWLLDEHRIAGVGVVPGTGHLENARATVARCVPAPDDDAVVELTDVAFLEPLSVPDGSAAEYRVGLDGTEFTVTSLRDGVRREHVRGSGGWTRPSTVDALDLDAVKARCVRAADDGDNPFRTGGRTSMLTFGPRWAALGEVHVGDGEELALIEAPAGARADLDRWVLHPSLLDVATSFGSRGEGSYLPLSYGRVEVRAPLPARFYSHLRYTETSAEVLTADLTLVDETGTPLVVVGDFTLRRVDTDSVARNLAGPAQEQVPVAEPTAGRGIRPADGAEAFRRVLAADLGPQVVINTETVAELVARIGSTTTDTIAADEPAADPVAGTGAEPATELEAVLARIWGRTIGVDHVGVDDDFFELGGNSLVAVQLIAQIRKAVGVRLPMRSLFDAPTVAGLAVKVEQLRAAEPAEAPARTIPKLRRNA
ncbi:acyl transferase domain-containing protein/acyl carrier protein [Saccharothrix tamanrassetensis]|uniref:Acyl transferase domain-containing protein/acyl carrier protein n=1 Tax=Saccharothrix tamanrassetensis TaxID=1051531 RepID=A0A841CIA1_9PSEU|nr:type I polyketide synthase [Saccharothrix tamanrassetensis]MBB5958242.1 acyl transferase domain-containing protein/acyl carrier protein [Saccharothrix tamanrassetensis]